MNLEEYFADLQQEVAVEAGREGAEQALPASFTERMISTLTEAGYIDDGVVAIYEARGMRASGFSVDPSEEVLDVFVTDYRPGVEPRTIGKTETHAAFRRLRAFVLKAQGGLWRQLEESDAAWDMAQRVEDLWKSLSKVRLTLLTNGRITGAPPPDAPLGDVPCSHHVWDLERLFKLDTSGRQQEPISVDFVQLLGVPLPCLGPEGTKGDYEAFLLMLPGEVLADIYAEFGPRLLELNVRSFLQARGKVNRGIQDTLRSEPSRFLAYNNGISLTASEVELVKGPNGANAIGAIHDVQIVNGGQTTASLHYARTKAKTDLSDVFVQAKLSVVEPSHLQDLVPRISQFSNSQNKVNMADFSATDPFHVELEKLSRSVWAPGKEGSHVLTRWFYERARGQYVDALAQERTPARRRQFKLVHPTVQKFTKTEVAKFENTWDQLPNVVALGAEKNFREFTLKLQARSSFRPDIVYFQRLVAKALLFRAAESLIGKLSLGGYRAQTVTYTVALISNRTAQAIDLDSIWASQVVPEPLCEAISELGTVVHKVLLESAGQQNISEWAKKPSCWERIQRIDWTPPTALTPHLMDHKSRRSAGSTSTAEVLTPAESASMEAVLGATADVWFELAAWAKQTDNLSPWQRGLAFSLGKLRASDRTPSRKQAIQGAKILEEAVRLGFEAQ